MQIEGRSSRGPYRFGGKNVIEVSVGRDDRSQLQLVPPEGIENGLRLVAGIDEDGLLGDVVADDVAVASKIANNEMFVDPQRHPDTVVGMNRPVVFKLSIDIEAPPEAIWPFLVDWEQLHLWMKEGRGFRVTSPHREGVGVTAEATIRIGGITTTDPIRISRWEPPRTLEMEHLGWVKGSGLMQCLAHAAGTRIEWTETLIPPWGILGAAGMRLLKPLMKRIFVNDLLRLKDLVERSASSK